VSEPDLIPAGGGEVIGDSPDRRVEILSDHEALHATWSRFGPHREGADLHVHRLHTDLFYVLAGELTVRLGVDDERVVVPAGTLARVPPLVVHGFLNGGDAELRYVNMHAPGQDFANYLRAMRDGRRYSYDQHPPPEDGGRPKGEAVVGGEEIVADRTGLRVALLADVDDLAVAEVRSASGGAAPPAHVHNLHIECFYVVEGELTFTFESGDTRVGAGSFALVPPGTVHTFAVTGEGEARFLNMHAPSCGFGTFVRGLHSARTDDELAEVRAAFDQETA
jgi:mannose-6-phosphate isomerase-like protein (cupin superfamily)